MANPSGVATTQPVGTSADADPGVDGSQQPRAVADGPSSAFFAAEVKGETRSDFCTICHDGGDDLVLCDRCDAAVCDDCVPMKHLGLDTTTVFFLCFLCHTRDERSAGGSNYMGLYHIAGYVEGRPVQGAPYREEPLRIVGIPSGVPFQRFGNTSTAFIHLSLASLASTTTEFCSSILRPSFTGTDGSTELLLEHVSFDLDVREEYAPDEGHKRKHVRKVQVVNGQQEHLRDIGRVAKRLRSMS
ncbi:hypothetical protein DENSPDRAFT_882490 [Dentipellis sp. KUC8613]|nr:hypothetical protein DENSPDRAFT_882490 [Dentipellis sp. KUC8613]